MWGQPPKSALSGPEGTVQRSRCIGPLALARDTYPCLMLSLYPY